MSGMMSGVKSGARGLVLFTLTLGLVVLVAALATRSLTGEVHAGPVAASGSEPEFQDARPTTLANADRRESIATHESLDACGATTRFVVVRSNGQPAAAADVEAEGIDGGRLHLGRTDAAGVLSAEVPAEWRGRFWATATNHATASVVALDGVQAEVVLTLTEGWSASGRVLGVEGHEPPAGTTVLARRLGHRLASIPEEGRTAHVVRGDLDAEGEFTVRDLDQGTDWYLQARSPGCTTSAAALVTEGSPTAELQLLPVYGVVLEFAAPDGPLRGPWEARPIGGTHGMLIEPQESGLRPLRPDGSDLAAMQIELPPDCDGWNRVALLFTGPPASDLALRPPLVIHVERLGYRPRSIVVQPPRLSGGPVPTQLVVLDPIAQSWGELRIQFGNPMVQGWDSAARIGPAARLVLRRELDTPIGIPLASASSGTAIRFELPTGVWQVYFQADIGTFRYPDTREGVALVVTERGADWSVPLEDTAAVEVELYDEQGAPYAAECILRISSPARPGVYGHAWFRGPPYRVPWLSPGEWHVGGILDDQVIVPGNETHRAAIVLERGTLHTSQVPFERPPDLEVGAAEVATSEK